jgi:hypothetical protein
MGPLCMVRPAFAGVRALARAGHTDVVSQGVPMGRELLFADLALCVGDLAAHESDASS